MEKWISLTMHSVHVGDKLQFDDKKNKPVLLEVRDMQTRPGGARRLFLADRTFYDMQPTDVLHGFCSHTT